MISGKILRDAIISGANNINNQRSRVDELNVFPVPDGDTGTNMGMTIGASGRELQALDDSCTVAEASKTFRLRECFLQLIDSSLSFRPVSECRHR